MKEIIAPADIDYLDTVTAFIETELDRYCVSEDIAVQLTVAAEEIFVNIAHYAYGGTDYPGEAAVSVMVSENPLQVTVQFSDAGVPYNPLDKEAPDTTLTAEERNIGGLGIHIVRAQMDNVEYEYKDGKNILTIRKQIQPPE